ncbi:MAG: phosphatidylserine/phosphatidylglycerophosphate/cardiolipin synthase family protein [Xanthomonadales bacterium]|nr:phosphatidylserine/phosphatidylglycerophosphate/cardiolipin synthase family protein [Xanthomonadales bacterium]
MSVSKIFTVLFRCQARAELEAPASARGAFINIGADFDAFQAVSKVFATAASDLLIVDPYFDVKALFEFCSCIPDNTRVRILVDSSHSKLTAALQPGIAKWRSQFGPTRPIDARATPPKVLHDRLISVDRSAVWILTQSFKDLAARSPASLQRADADVADAKRDAYEQIWLASAAL